MSTRNNSVYNLLPYCIKHDSSKLKIPYIQESIQPRFSSTNCQRYLNIRSFLSLFLRHLPRPVQSYPVLRERRHASTDWWQLIADWSSVVCNYHLLILCEPTDIISSLIYKETANITTTVLFRLFVQRDTAWNRYNKTKFKIVKKKINDVPCVGGRYRCRYPGWQNRNGSSFSTDSTSGSPTTNSVVAAGPILFLSQGAFHVAVATGTGLKHGPHVNCYFSSTVPCIALQTWDPQSFYR